MVYMSCGRDNFDCRSESKRVCSNDWPAIYYSTCTDQLPTCPSPHNNKQTSLSRGDSHSRHQHPNLQRFNSRQQMFASIAQHSTVLPTTCYTVTNSMIMPSQEVHCRELATFTTSSLHCLCKCMRVTQRIQNIVCRR
jgi:hypothetical protein